MELKINIFLIYKYYPLFFPLVLITVKSNQAWQTFVPLFSLRCPSTSLNASKCLLTFFFFFRAKMCEWQYHNNTLWWFLSDLIDTPLYQSVLCSSLVLQSLQKLPPEDHTLQIQCSAVLTTAISRTPIYPDSKICPDSQSSACSLNTSNHRFSLPGLALSAKMFIGKHWN